MSSITPAEWRTPKGERRRDLLLRAARTVIAQRGYAGATQRSIAAEAGVAAASTHYFFESVEDLVQRSASQYLDERVTFYEAWIDQFEAGDRSVADACKFLVQVLMSIPNEARSTQFE